MSPKSTIFVARTVEIPIQQIEQIPMLTVQDFWVIGGMTHGNISMLACREDKDQYWQLEGTAASDAFLHLWKSVIKICR